MPRKGTNEIMDAINNLKVVIELTQLHPLMVLLFNSDSKIKNQSVSNLHSTERQPKHKDVSSLE